MFGQLIESIRHAVVEGPGYADQYDRGSSENARAGKRSSTAGSKSRAKRGSGRDPKTRAARLMRRDTKKKLRMGDYDKLRRRVTQGHDF